MPNSRYIVGIDLVFATLGLPLYWETIRYYVRVTPAGIERRVR